MERIAVVVRCVLCGLVLAGLAGCARNYSPNTYASNAVQQAAKVDQGVVVGMREVAVSADTTAGTLTGAAAGGIAGSQVGGGVGSAFGALGGTVVGGLAGSAVEHVQGDTRAFEYIVRKANGDLISVTQKDTQPLQIGQHVLVIAGQQARIVPDYTVPLEATKTDKPADASPVTVPAVPMPGVPVAPTVSVPPVPIPVIPSPPSPAADTPAMVPTPLTPPLTPLGEPPKP